MAIIHEQQGLVIRSNEKNGFTVCRLHYTADPRKRTLEWKREAEKGLTAAQFDQEFEINYQAGMGQKAFPEIISKRVSIVLSESPYLDGAWPSHLSMWGGFDYGANNPSAFEVFTVVDGVTYALWELYEPCKNLPEFIKHMKLCPYWEQIRYIVHDPDISNLKQRDMRSGDVTSVRAQFEQLGVTRWLTGVTDEQGWISTMRRHWSGDEITFKILPTCPMLIDEFEKATFISMSERQLETQNYREALRDKHNHALDACKYFMNNGSAKPIRIVKLPTLVAGYSWNAGNSLTPHRERELGLSR